MGRPLIANFLFTGWDLKRHKPGHDPKPGVEQVSFLLLKATRQTAAAQQRVASLPPAPHVEVLHESPAPSPSAPRLAPMAQPGRGARQANETGVLGNPLPRPAPTALVTPPDQQLQEIERELAPLPKLQMFMSDEDKSLIAQRMTQLLQARNAMLPAQRARADAMLDQYLSVLIHSVDETTPAPRKEAIVDHALRGFGDPTKPFHHHDRTIAALMHSRHHFQAQLRDAGPDGKAPELLRRHAGALLTAYRAHLLQLQKANVQARTEDWDNLVLPLLLQAQNARTDGLDARLLTLDQLVALVDSHKDQEGGTIGLIDFGASAKTGSSHHAAVYVTTAQDRPPRITVVDSYDTPGLDLLSLVGDLPTGAKVFPVVTKTQNARECIVYALAAANKINDHREAVDAAHQHSTSRATAVIHKAIDGTQCLPPAFFKHSQSRSTLDRLGQAANDAVDKQGRSLLQRWDDAKVERPSDKDTRRTVTYSASIEGKRLKLVEHALAHHRASGA